MYHGILVHHAIARCPLFDSPQPQEYDFCYRMEFLSEGPLTFQDIQKETEKDVVLKRVIHRQQNGWRPEDSCSELAP